ncbi:ABC transporter, ATPase subunit [Pedobacter sp. BAL39]|uniref:ABC transporter ATP-binding protein n=1 Tax=Pedobacter sp. BAL39 TaxID=391596 RepID=UPI000155971A|nr:ABC transporter ATP-binding protein [Pedobacter sp. BAL39]EDM36922.1 ABC transporter, ATPase subunit [Pedobacter sp. BAL39]
MQDSIVKIEQLSHRYGRDWAIQNINFEIRENEGILGLLGSNGAGKSTIMNILCGVLTQTSGNVSIGGIDLAKEPEEAKKLLGFLPQTPPLYFDFTVKEYLTYCAYLRLIPEKQIPEAVDRAMEKCGVAHFHKRLINNLSGGYRQRVGIAQAILHTPRLVVLDEPTNGLDPNQILEVRGLIKEIAQDRSVIFSSHILAEVQATCQHIRMIESGKMVFEDSMDAFNNYIQPDSLLATWRNPPAISELLLIPGISGAEVLNNGQFRLHFQNNPDITEMIIDLSGQHNWRLREITLERSSLEAIFAQLSNKTKKISE